MIIFQLFMMFVCSLTNHPSPPQYQRTPPLERHEKCPELTRRAPRLRLSWSRPGHNKQMRFFVLCLALVATALSAGLTNKAVSRLIDIQGDIVFIRANITMENGGSDNVASFQYPLDHPIETVSAFEVRTDADVLEAKYDASSKAYTVKFTTPLARSKSITVQSALVLAHVVRPIPATISQEKPQLVKFFDNHYFSSPYPTKEQVTRIVTRAQKIESYSKVNPTTASKEGIVVAGPYKDIAANQFKELMIHFDDNVPFATVKKTTKDIMISHWSGLSTEEHYIVENTGAKLDGFFSRFDMQMRRMVSPATVLGLHCTLPPFSHDIYYRDDIGNISTSAVNQTLRGVDLDIVPRFPLFGGWKVDFQVGYTTPLVVFQSKEIDKKRGAHQLVVPVVPTMSSVVADEVEVRLALPEGAHNVAVDAPAGFTWELSSEKTYGLLDVVGRPTIVFRGRMVIPMLGGAAQVSYDYNTMRLLAKPAWVGLYVVIALVAVVATRRFVAWLHSGPIPTCPGSSYLWRVSGDVPFGCRDSASMPKHTGRRPAHLDQDEEILEGRPPELTDITPDGEPDYGNACKKLNDARELTADVRKMLNTLRDAYVICAKATASEPAPTSESDIAKREQDSYELRVAYALTLHGGAKLLKRLTKIIDVARSQKRRPRAGASNLIGFRLLLDSCMTILAGPESLQWPVQSETEAAASMRVVDAQPTEQEQLRSKVRAQHKKRRPFLGLSVRTWAVIGVALVALVGGSAALSHFTK
ncbi:putative Dolichyl-diphosphooligosaccharide--protein glycosyltransferase subunit 1 [Paratrimastix pyriformis]|uniref:Dolichyl-diphosphooligosaccharide--protein glycosyltransferase subunit 1 n=1 Tax=Paratrimastix pyriformis TaxID=342808 RepID=A0ABQ8UTC9_9EUKA|nr:putative Dolichyl-diphosphooligosaccharide--protein glycosyltransferase subunit 1 [Paratrimastix pyriformis]